LISLAPDHCIALQDSCKTTFPWIYHTRNLSIKYYLTNVLWSQICWELFSRKDILYAARLQISGVASQFATQISGIATQSTHLICNSLHKIKPKLIRNVKNCYTKCFFSIGWKNSKIATHWEKSYFEPCAVMVSTCQWSLDPDFRYNLTNNQSKCLEQSAWVTMVMSQGNTITWTSGGVLLIWRQPVCAHNFWSVL
jgi:hypothetical protein